MRARGAATAAVVVALTMVAGACGGGSARRASPSDRPRRIVPGPATDFVRIIVTAGGRSAEVPAEQRAELVPLLAAKTFDDPEPLATYGLDHPEAVLLYERGVGGAAVVQLGDANFDHHGVYARRPDDRVVFLVLADTLRPVLALVGIDLPPPTD